MQINPGSDDAMPASPSHLTLTIESFDAETDEKTKKRFRCRYEGCSRTYSSAGNLKAHIKSHTGAFLSECFVFARALTGLLVLFQASTPSSVRKRRAAKPS